MFWSAYWDLDWTRFEVYWTRRSVSSWWKTRQNRWIRMGNSWWDNRNQEFAAPHCWGWAGVTLRAAMNE